MSAIAAKAEKTCMDCVWLNPKRINNGQSAAKLRTGERSTTIPQGSTIASDWQLETVNNILNN